jgi:hypothetical protein
MRKILIAFIVCGLAVMIAVALSSCSVTKNKATESTSIDEHDIIDVDSLVRAKLDSAAVQYLQQIRKLQSELVFGENCNDDSLNAIIYRLNNSITRLSFAFADSMMIIDELRSTASDLHKLKKEPGKLFLRADGTFEAIGLRTANMKLIDSLTQMSVVRKQLQSETELRVKAEHDLKAASKVDVKGKKSGFPWLVAIISFVLGIAVIIGLAAWVDKQNQKTNSHH